MRVCLLFLGISGLILCSAQVSDDEEPHRTYAYVDSSQVYSLTLGINFKPSETYNAAKLKVKNGIKTTSTGKDFENYLLNDIIPTGMEPNGISTGIPPRPIKV